VVRSNADKSPICPFAKGRAAGPGDFAISRISMSVQEKLGLPEAIFIRERSKGAKKRQK
jgi:hypothetical protein